MSEITFVCQGAECDERYTPGGARLTNDEPNPASTSMLEIENSAEGSKYCFENPENNWPEESTLSLTEVPRGVKVYRNLLDSRRAFGEIWGQVSNGLLNFEETPPVERARGPLQRLDGNQVQYQPRLSDVIGKRLQASSTQSNDTDAPNKSQTAPETPVLDTESKGIADTSSSETESPLSSPGSRKSVKQILNIPTPKSIRHKKRPGKPRWNSPRSLKPSTSPRTPEEKKKIYRYYTKLSSPHTNPNKPRAQAVPRQKWKLPGSLEPATASRTPDEKRIVNLKYNKLCSSSAKAHKSKTQARGTGSVQDVAKPRWNSPNALRPGASAHTPDEKRIVNLKYNKLCSSSANAHKSKTQARGTGSVQVVAKPRWNSPNALRPGASAHTPEERKNINLYYSQLSSPLTKPIKSSKVPSITRPRWNSPNALRPRASAHTPEERKNINLYYSRLSSPRTKPIKSSKVPSITRPRWNSSNALRPSAADVIHFTVMFVLVMLVLCQRQWC